MISGAASKSARVSEGLGQARVAGRQGGDQGLGQHAGGGELGPLHRRADQADVDAAGQQGLDLLAGDHLAQGQVGVGQAGRDRITRRGRKL
jgi:hypothetical protein